MASESGTVELEAPEAPPEPKPATREKPDTRSKPKRQPPYAVVLHNDSINGMDFVVGVLRKVFHYGRLRSLVMMLRAHTSGRSIIWTGSLEVAELKVEQVRGCGPDPRKPRAKPLKVTAEPLPD